MKEVENSCGGSGCNTPEHEKRLGTDNTGSFVCLLNMEAMEVQLSHKTNIGDLVMFLEERFGADWPEVNIVNIKPLVTYSIAN